MTISRPLLRKINKMPIYFTPNVELEYNFRGELIHPGSILNAIWLIFRNLFPVMHHLPSIWLRNAGQTDLYVLDVAPGSMVPVETTSF